MKKSFFILSSILLISVFAQAQTAPKAVSAATPTVTPAVKPVEPANASKAEITFEKDFHDFGTIEFAGKGTYDFKFKNTGTEPLIISDAKGSCGCTVPTYPKNIPILPGESQVVKVTYDTKRVGNFTKTVTISSNSNTPVKSIMIKGTVSPEVTEEVFPIGGKGDNGATPFEKH